MAYRARIVLALFILRGCSGDQLTEQQNEKVRRLSDMDDDGMYFSDDCMSGGDDCLIVPGPLECTYLEITTTTTVIVDASGNIVSEETVVCTKCLDADFSVISESCEGMTEPPVICEPIPYATPAEGDVPAGGGSSGGVPGGECWWCHSEDGSISYVECIDPPPPVCWTDADCPAGYHCEYYPDPPPCSMDPGVPCTEPTPTPRLIAPEGQCVPDAPLPCTSDTDCPDGYYCELYSDPCSDPSVPCPGSEPGGGGGSDGSGSGDAAPFWAGGQCLPLPSDCRSHLTPEECTADPACAWYEADADVPCTPDSCGGGGGYCDYAYVPF